MSPYRHWVAPTLYMALIIGLSSIPGSTGPDTPSGPAGWIPPIVSNALHVPVYAGLGFLWTQALMRTGPLPLKRALFAALVIAAVFGIIDELYQGLIPGRTAAFADWLADAAGAALGCALFAMRKRLWVDRAQS